MASNNVVKEDERKSLSVHEDTHARIARLIRVIGYERDANLNQDDIVREALDCYERERARKN